MMKVTTSQRMSLVLGLIGTIPAFAQTETANTAVGGLEEVIVTAQKRAENLQDVPISITAVSGETLAKSGVMNLDALQRLAPGLTMSTVGSGFVSYTYLRGGGTNQPDPGSDPSVAFFVDEVYIGGAAGLQFDLFDIERIEVLKGPQGTIFGRNAASGAISVVTKRPSETVGADVALEYGNYDALLARGSITGPVTDDGSLLFRLSGSYRQRDGVTRNLAGGKDPGHIDSGGVRGQLEWRGDDVTVLLAADFLRARNGQTNQFLSGPSTAAFLDPTLPLPGGESFYRHYYDVIGYENQNLRNFSARIDWDTSIGTLSSISAYRHNEFRRLQDNDMTAYDAFVNALDERDESFSQEIRLAGDVMGGRLRYVAGVYYYRADIDYTTTVQAGPAFPTAPVRGSTAIDSTAVLTNSYAVFGQATYDLTDRVSLTVGGCYTEDRKKNDRNVNRFGLATFSVSPRATFSDFTPAVTLDFKPTDEILAYVSYREGFKSGGFQSVLPPSAAIADTPFLPEEVTSYEVGLKTSLFDRRLQANLAVFRSDIDNQQVSVSPAPATAIIDNAGETRTDGVDVQLTLKPIVGLTLSADVTVQEARFRKYTSGAVSFAGNSQLRSPDFASYFSAEYVLPVSGWGEWSLRGEYSRRSKTYFDAANPELAGLYQPAYGIGNVRLGLSLSALPLDIALFANNVSDERYYRNIAISGLSDAAVPGDPRTYGISLGYHWR